MESMYQILTNLLNMLLAFGGLIACANFIMIIRDRWRLAIPVILIFLHALIFYIASILRYASILSVSDVNFFTNWSSILRAQELVTLAGFVYYMTKFQELRRKRRSDAI